MKKNKTKLSLIITFACLALLAMFTIIWLVSILTNTGDGPTGVATFSFVMMWVCAIIATIANIEAES